MIKEYIFEFRLHDHDSGYSKEGVQISLAYDTFEEALEEAKFYFEVFFDVLWSKARGVWGAPDQKKTILSFEELLERTFNAASKFELIPNKSEFDFIEFAKSRYNFYVFRDDMFEIGCELFKDNVGGWVVSQPSE